MLNSMLFIVFISVLFFTQLDSQAAIPTRKELKIGSTQEIDNPNPMLASMIISSYIYTSVGRTLNIINADGKWEPQLAKETPTLENKKARFIGKGKKRKIEASWEIKDNAKWGDGTHITGHDVKFSHEVALNPNVAVARIQPYRNIEKITVNTKNPKKFKILYKKATWDFFRMPDFYILPKHLEKKPFDKHKSRADGYSKNSLYTKNPTNPGLYSGPYVITEVKLGSHITIKRNPYFYGKKANIEKIIYKLIPNTSTLESNLRSGTIDMISFVGLSFDQALAFDKRVNKKKLNYKVNFVPGLVYEHIDLNKKDNEFLKDKRVRQALIYAINRDNLSKALFENKQPKALHRFAPTDPWYIADPNKIKLYNYSRRKAKKLLANAGWKKGKDGYLYKGTKKLTLQIKTTSGNKVRELVQVFIQNELKKVGVELTIKNEPARVFFGETIKKFRYSMAMYAWSFLPEDNLKNYYHSTSIPTAKNGFSGNNWSAWSHKEVDKILDEIDEEFDAKKRLNLAHRFIKIYTEEAPVIPLYYRSNISVVPKNLKGYKLPAHQFTATNHIEYWDL